MKIRRKAHGGGRRNAQRLLREVMRAGAGAPLEAMAELMRLGREDAGARDEIMAATIAVFGEDPGSFTACWLALVVGELATKDVSLLLHGMGPSEALDAAILPALTRRACEVFEGVVEAFTTGVAAKVAAYRADLYEILHGVVLKGDVALKERLVSFALERVEVERGYPAEGSALGEPLLLLAMLGHPETESLLREARTRCARGDGLDRALDDVATSVRGDRDFLDRARLILAADWRFTAFQIEQDFGRSEDAASSDQ